MSSYENINYSIRPAKNIERKLIRDVLFCLSNKHSLPEYTYVGFGSTFFVDFKLFHETLHINKMISIEKDVERQKRFLFNRPYNCIDIEFGKSTEVLPRLDYNKKTITWLDFDYSLDKSILADVKSIVNRVQNGSVLILSLNVHQTKTDPNKKDLSPKKQRLNSIIKDISEKKFPAGFLNENFTQWKKADLYEQVLKNEIEETLKVRNAVSCKNIYYKRILNFRYQDGARMMTVGYVFYHDKQDLHQFSFEMFDFVKCRTPPVYIDTPHLTLKEIRHLNNQLPRKKEFGKLKPRLNLPGVKYEEAIGYEKFYKYFPNFTEANIF